MFPVRWQPASPLSSYTARQPLAGRGPDGAGVLGQHADTKSGEAPVSFSNNLSSRAEIRRLVGYFSKYFLSLCIVIFDAGVGDNYTMQL